MICEGCGFDWTGHEICDQFDSITTCPECPQVIEEEEEDGSD